MKKEIAPIFKKHGLDPDHLMREAVKTSRTAASIIMGYYNAAEHDESAIEIEIKEDESPVTKADKESSHFIEARLRQLTPDIAVISEENDEKVSHEDPYWVIDPLDGTKLFIGRTGGFAINIALMLESTPVLGVVNCPAYSTVYYSHESSPAFRQTKKLPAQTLSTNQLSARKIKKGHLKTLFDMAHGDPALYETERLKLIQKALQLPPTPICERTLPQNLMIAEGLADIHVKTGTKGSAGYVWDMAADHIILKNAGGIMINLTDGLPLRFDTVRDRLPPVIAFGDKELGKRAFPQP